LLYNKTNSIIIIVTLVKHAASNINAILLPAPVLIITTIRLFYYIIALIASYYIPLNIASYLTNFSN
jgi:hypothetical protein